MPSDNGAFRPIAAAGGLTVPFAAPLRAVQAVATSREENALVVRASKRIEASDPYLGGHFPQFPIFPGVFILEAAIQAVTIGVAERTGREPALVRVTSARFVAPLRPGDVLTVDATVRPLSGDGPFDVRAVCFRNGVAPVAHLKLQFAAGEAPDA